MKKVEKQRLLLAKENIRVLQRDLREVVGGMRGTYGCQGNCSDDCSHAIVCTSH